MSYVIKVLCSPSSEYSLINGLRPIAVIEIMAYSPSAFPAFLLGLFVCCKSSLLYVVSVKACIYYELHGYATFHVYFNIIIIIIISIILLFR